MNMSLSEAVLDKKCIIEKIDAPKEEKLRLYDAEANKESE